MGFPIIETHINLTHQQSWQMCSGSKECNSIAHIQRWPRCSELEGENSKVRSMLAEVFEIQLKGISKAHSMLACRSVRNLITFIAGRGVRSSRNATLEHIQCWQRCSSSRNVTPEHIHSMTEVFGAQ